jgi:glycosyltransferase involved in cell wall biosynthesis
MLCESFGALGGVAQIVEELACEFARAGHRVAVVSNTHKGGAIARPQNPSVEQVWVDLPRVKPISLRHPERLFRRNNAPQLAAFIRQWAPDLINIHGGLRDRFPPVLKACAQTKLPIVQSFHLVPEWRDHSPDDVRLNKLSNIVLRAARAITFPSIAVKQGFMHVSEEAGRAEIIRGGVNVEQAENAERYIHVRPYIFSASRLDLQHKAVDVLITAFGLVARELSDLDLLIAGDGPHRTQIEEMITGSPFAEQIHLLPALPHNELWSLYKGAELFVMLSRIAEGLPLVFFESMACGTPVIGSDGGGTPEIIVDGETGLLVTSNDPGIVAAAIRRLLANPGERAELGRRGRELVRNYDWRSAASSYLDLYRNMLQSMKGEHP